MNLFLRNARRYVADIRNSDRRLEGPAAPSLLTDKPQETSEHYTVSALRFLSIVPFHSLCLSDSIGPCPIHTSSQHDVSLSDQRLAVGVRGQHRRAHLQLTKNMPVAGFGLAKSFRGEKRNDWRNGLIAGGDPDVGGEHLQRHGVRPAADRPQGQHVDTAQEGMAIRESCSRGSGDTSILGKRLGPLALQR
jgi:hypothetical protein